MRLAIASAIAGLLVAGAFFTSLALAHDESEGTPVILRPKDGAVVRGPVTMIVGFKNARGAVHDEDMKATMNDATKQMGQMDQKAQMGQMGEMHRDEQHHGAHLHLIVDSPLPKEGTTVPMDEKHIHLMNSEQTTVLNLAPGRHTLAPSTYRASASRRDAMAAETTSAGWLRSQLLEHFPKRLNRGIPLRERIGFKVRAGMEASMDGETVFGGSACARRWGGTGWRYHPGNGGATWSEYQLCRALP